MDPSLQLWFHGLISRELAEKKLLNFSKNDGTFLVRASTSLAGSYVLSVVHNEKVVHYQLKKKADGLIAIDGGSPFHGPVELVEYHKTEKDRLLTKLVAPCARSDGSEVEAFHRVSHADLEEAIQVSLLHYKIDDADAVKELKGRLQHVIGNVLHKEQPWFHGVIPRTEADDRIEKSGGKEGMFLIRERGSPRGTYAIVLCHNQKCFHYLLEPNSNGQLCIKDGRPFDNLMGVVTFYSQNKEGLWCRMQFPCDVKKFEYRPRTEIHDRNILLNSYIQAVLKGELGKMQDVLKKYKAVIPKEKPKPTKSSFKPDESHPKERQPTDALPPLPSEEPKKFEKIYDTRLAVMTGYANQLKSQDGVSLKLESKRLKLESSELGHGNFGSVWRGTYKMGLGKKLSVAIKTLKDDEIPNQKNEFIAEAGIMAKLDHQHIVRLIGVTQTPSLMIVMELAPLGPLNKYLKKNKMDIRKILILMLQVSQGMDYLQGKQFVHRDLAARNVLLVSEDFAKISDFGMSRAIGAGNEFYRAERRGKWPLKWYAPECIYYGIFTSKGDVWSYGVTLWEALSYGKTPYSGLKGNEIVELLEAGKRLGIPVGCPDQIYTLMNQCWCMTSEDRPSFLEIGTIIYDLLESKAYERNAVSS